MRRALPDLLWTLLLAAVVALAPSVLKALFAQASVSYLSIAANAISLAILALSWDLLARTRLGRAMRAVAQNRVGASLVGLEVNRIYLVAFALSALLAGICGL